MSSTRGLQNFQLSEGSFFVDITKYVARKKAEKSIIIIPPTGGTNIIDRQYAKRFRRAGYDAYILNFWTGYFEIQTDLEVHQRFYSNAQKAIELTLNSIKTPYIGMLGTSVGAMHTSIAVAAFERLNAAFAIVGGAPIAEVVVKSDLDTMRELHAARKSIFGFKSDQEYIQALDQAIELEPLRMGNNHHNKKLGMAIATKDSTVTFDTQLKLLDFWKPEKVITHKSNHYWGIVKTWAFHRSEIVRFFDESLN